MFNFNLYFRSKESVHCGATGVYIWNDTYGMCKTSYSCYRPVTNCWNYVCYTLYDAVLDTGKLSYKNTGIFIK